MFKRALSGVLALLALQSALTAGQAVQVAQPRVRDGRVYVSFQLSDAFNADVLSAIHSGLPITFVYDVELRRGAAVWLDRTLDSATVSAGVQYNNLTRRYTLTLWADGRLEAQKTLDREEDARAWLTQFEQLNLFSAAKLEPYAEYYVRVRARRTPSNASFVWPWQGTDVAGLAKFTFLR